MRLKVTTEKMVCKSCGSVRIVKYGKYGDSQLWLCRDCGKKWTDNKAVIHGKLPSECVSYALGAYYDGMSINAIRRNLKQQYDVYPSSATVFEWITKYTQEVIGKTKELHPSVGDTWIADETYVRVDRQKKNTEQVVNPYDATKKGKWVIFWDIIDADTRFLLASVVATTRGKQDAKKLMELASERAGKIPKVVVTDSLNSYLDGIELAYGKDATHKQGTPFEIENNTNLIERFHSTLKMRTRVMRGLRNAKTTQFFTDGWLAFYNYLKPHMSLDKTPAEEARLDYPFKDWSDVIQPSQKQSQLTVTYERPPRLPPLRRLPVIRRAILTPPRPRISRKSKPPILKGNQFYVGHGAISRHYFSGAKRRRIR